MNARERLEKLLSMASFIHDEINVAAPAAVIEYVRESYPAVRRLRLIADSPNTLHVLGASGSDGTRIDVNVYNRSLLRDGTLDDLVGNLRVADGQAHYSDETGWYFDIPAICVKCGRTAEEDESCADDTYGRHTWPA